MIYWGINALNHGSSLAVFKDGRLVSNTFNPSDELDGKTIYNALNSGSPDRIFWYERPWVKKARQLYAGQFGRAFDLEALPSRYLKRIRVDYAPVTYTPHHASHAAAGYYTSPFNHCAIVVLDAIGEFECATIWEAHHGEMKKVWSRSYPNSLGLFYSAFTQAMGMTPIADEGKLQAMAAQGNPRRFYYQVSKYFDGLLQLNYNFHKGVRDQRFYIDSVQDEHDLAAAVQLVFEEQINLIMTVAKSITGADSLVYMGGCAMNSKANRLIADKWKYIWSLPNPGDPSSSIGAVLYHTKDKVAWTGDLAKHIEIKV